MTPTTIPYDTLSTTSKEPTSIFDRCCCCIPLRVGCLIMGYLSLIANVFITLRLLVVTTYFGVVTNGFDHMDPDTDQDDQTPSEQALEMEIQRPIFNYVGVLLIVEIICNVIWLAIIITFLVGLHKKRHVTIRVCVRFATARFLLSFIGFIYSLQHGYMETPQIVIRCIDLSLVAYFILICRIYAGKLEREIIASRLPVEVQVQDVSFIYPNKIDKELLVESK